MFSFYKVLLELWFRTSKHTHTVNFLNNKSTVDFHVCAKRARGWLEKFSLQLGSLNHCCQEQNSQASEDANWETCLYKLMPKHRSLTRSLNIYIGLLLLFAWWSWLNRKLLSSVRRRIAFAGLCKFTFRGSPEWWF